MAKTAFLFPGQGAQQVGMAKQLCETLPAARALFDEAAAILGYDLLGLCSNGPAEQLNSTVISQPAIFVASLAALESLRTTDAASIEGGQGAAGLSLGEYTALAFAGVFSFADGLRLVKQRGEAMQAAADATPSGMVSIIGLEVPKIEELCAQAREGDTLEVANLLCPGNTALSGTSAACDRVAALAEAAGARVVRLAVAGAFHTSIMKPADDQLAAALARIELKPARVPVWSNVDAQPHTDPAEIRALLVRQVVSPVLFERSLRNLLAAGFDRFVECGPGRVLAGLLKRVQRKVDVANVSV